MKKNIFTLSFIAFSSFAMAQSGTNSPYSKYGLGALSDQSQGFNKGMNGVGLAFKEHNKVNYINPASYSEIDSLSFIFDIGASLQSTNFSERGVKKNVNNANIEYAVAAFRAAKGLGISFGFVPYSNIGYNFSYTTQQPIAGYKEYPTTEENTYYTQSHNGNGGLHQLYLGAGWSPVRGLSVGANINYIWGTLERNMSAVFTSTSLPSVSTQYTSTINNIKIDLGAMYSFNINSKDEMTIGATYSPKRNLGANATYKVGQGTYENKDGYSIPEQIGIGLSFCHNKQWKIGADYSVQNWSKVDYPTFVDSKNEYVTTSGLFNDRHKINVGGEYCNNEYSLRFANRIRYRFGAGYTTPYLKFGNADGPKEYSVSAGIGLPIINAYNTRSILNISVQWSNYSAENLIKENTFRINIGLTFNERWFAKWKFD